MRYQKFIQWTMLAFVVGGIALLVVPKQWSFTIYHPSYLGIMFLISATLIYLPSLAPGATTPAKKELIQKTQAVLAAALSLNGLGELGCYQLYRVGFEYDKLAHLTGSLLFTVVVGEIWLLWKKYSFWQLAWRTAVIILVAGLGWEAWEISSDIFFHTQEWGVYGQYKQADTLGDLFWNGVGIICGLLILKNTLKKTMPRQKS